MDYKQWLTIAETQLQETVTENPSMNGRQEAILLLQIVTKRSKASILAFSETLLTATELAQLSAVLARRVKGEPIAYIVGEKEFWSLPLKVSTETLIPRPDTEILVEQALDMAKQRLNSPHFSGELAMLDLGTGTGAIALALASELQPIAQKCGVRLRIVGVDRIAEAVALAQENATANQLSATFLQSTWFDELSPDHPFDLIVSNPPYIDEKDPHLALGDVRFEPLSALVAAEQGYADLRHIIEQAPLFLKPKGALLLEHGWQQGEKVRSIFAENGWQQIQTLQDYGHNERVTSACIEG
ncbi:peptide chain release factor N(5)-glutamine methyltransferase [Pasteurella sp. PK-2025]|uniref:peptide chain release factor N(5)-glutamine methyltransferase n=1 Tax=unclassified Pasteurella TaxID=2621516 RepID=UPI003C73604A